MYGKFRCEECGNYWESAHVYPRRRRRTRETKRKRNRTNIAEPEGGSNRSSSIVERDARRGRAGASGLSFSGRSLSRGSRGRGGREWGRGKSVNFQEQETEESLLQRQKPEIEVNEYYSQGCSKCSTYNQPFDVQETRCSQCGKVAKYCGCVNQDRMWRPHRSDLCEKCAEGYPCQEADDFVPYEEAFDFDPYQEADDFDPCQEADYFVPDFDPEEFDPCQEADYFVPDFDPDDFDPCQEAYDFDPYQEADDFDPYQEADDFDIYN